MISEEVLRLQQDAQKHFDNGIIDDEYHFFNPHKISHTKIFGLDKVENTKNQDMPITNALRDELVKYFSVTDIVNKNTYDGQPSTPSDLEQSEIEYYLQEFEANIPSELKFVPLSASAGKSLNDTIIGMGNIGETVEGYNERISKLELAFA